MVSRSVWPRSKPNRNRIIALLNGARSGVGLTIAAVVAFAANSLLARAALDSTTIDAVTFTALRIGSGALVLGLLVRARRTVASGHGSWGSAAALFAYALLFSLAYRGLTAATGALLLFGAVQVTMLSVARARGETLRAGQWLGMMVALTGLVYLLWPGLAAPPARDAACMLGAGIAWGVYTLRAKGSGDPTAATASNFLRASVPALALLAVFAVSAQWDVRGVVYALLSGALASGLGYAIWYAALRRIGTPTAAVSQLAVPVLTAVGGVLLLAEPMSGRLALAGLLVLAGMAAVIRSDRPAHGGADRA